MIPAVHEVVGPDGRTWVVRRRWGPRLGAQTVWGRFHRRFRQTLRRTGDLADVDPGCSLDLGEGIVVVVLVILFLLLAVFVAIPLLVALLDLLLVVLLAIAGVVARVAFRRPWTVEATAGDGTRLRWRVVGWRASGVRRGEVAQLLGAGIVPPEDVPPPLG